MHNFYIIAHCNGAGKTTASSTILPGILGCHEFVNAHAIAYGLSSGLMVNNCRFTTFSFYPETKIFNSNP